MSSAEIPLPPELGSKAGLVADELLSWLRQEVISSSSDHNAVLDDWDRYSKDLNKDFDDTMDAAKNNSHQNRLNIWTLEWKDNPTNDYMLARQLFCIQMYLSGNYRIQCKRQATSKDDYLLRRSAHTPLDTGEDIEQSLQRVLSTLPPEIDAIIDKTNEVNSGQREVLEYTHSRGKEDQGQDESPSVYALNFIQDAWTNLFGDYIAFAATQNKGLEHVPLLEPKSITRDPQIYYPFSKPAQ